MEKIGLKFINAKKGLRGCFKILEHILKQPLDSYLVDLELYFSFVARPPLI